MIDVIGLDCLGGFKLRVRFSDGCFGEHDFRNMIAEPGPMLEPLRDSAYFDRVFIELGAPTWPNGFDLAPEWLRREMAAAGELHRDRSIAVDGEGRVADSRRIMAPEPDKLGGRACVRGLRIAVADVLGWLAAGMTPEEIVADHPELTAADVRACLEYAAERERASV